MQRWFVIQHELMPELRNEVAALTPKLEHVIHTLEWVRIEEFARSTWGGCGRPAHDRGMLDNAFVAKAVLGWPTPAGLIKRRAVDRVLRRICGFSMWKKLPGESTFSRVSALLSSASMQDSLAAIPLSLMTAERVTICYGDGCSVLQRRVEGTQP